MLVKDLAAQWQRCVKPKDELIGYEVWCFDKKKLCTPPFCPPVPMGTCFFMFFCVFFVFYGRIW